MVSARLTLGVHDCTLSREERCARSPQLSERVGAAVCLSTLPSKIDPSELAVLKGCRERGVHAALGGRLLSVLTEALSALLRGEAQIEGGVCR